jgi:hypothetical protein
MPRADFEHVSPVFAQFGTVKALGSAPTLVILLYSNYHQNTSHFSNIPAIATEILVTLF